MSDLKNNKEKALAIAQKYLGMMPKDLGCDHWAEMNEKSANEIVSLVNDTDRDRDLLLNFVKTLKLARMVEGLDGDEEFRGITNEDIGGFIKSTNHKSHHKK